MMQTPIGKVDEILGPINQVYFTIKPQEGIVATSFKSGDKFYIAGDKLLPLEKYAPLPIVDVLRTYSMYSGSYQSQSRHQVTLLSSTRQGDY